MSAKEALLEEIQKQPEPVLLEVLRYLEAGGCFCARDTGLHSI